MFDFGTSLNSFTGGNEATGDTGERKKFVPVPKGKYVLKCVGSIIKNSKGGTPCWYLSFDIAKGEHAGKFAKYPRMVYQSLNNEVGKGFAQRYIKMFVANNPDMISPDVLEGSTFDESQIVGLEIGGELDFIKSEKYLDIKGLMNIADVA